MDFKPVFVFALIVLIEVAAAIAENDYFDNEKSFERNYNAASLNNKHRKPSPRSLKYEVFENVVDIPDDREPKRAAVTYYKLNKPFNNVTNVVGNNDKTKPDKSNENITEYLSENSNYHSVHETEHEEHTIKKCIDNTDEEISPNQKDKTHPTTNILPNGLHKGLLEKVFNNINKVLKTPNVVDTPVGVYKKSEIAAKTLQNTIFGKVFADNFDDFF